MPIALPSGPTLNQQVTTAGKTYQWNGRFWKVVVVSSVPGGGSSAWDDITGKPADFTPSAHTQAISSITGLDAALAAKQAAGSYLTSETDPVFSASAAAGISGTNVSNWNAAYGWGSHGSAGYLLPATIGVSVQGYNASTVIDAAYVHTDSNFTAAEKSKLAGVASGATANSSDATLLDRANHTGTQAQSTVANLVADLASKAPLASPTFTGTVTLPTGQAVNGVTLTTAGGTTNFLRADGTYAAPPGGGGGGASPILSWMI